MGDVGLIVEVDIDVGNSDVVGFEVVGEGFKVEVNVGLIVEVGISVDLSDIVGFEVVVAVGL